MFIDELYISNNETMSAIQKLSIDDNYFSKINKIIDNDEAFLSEISETQLSFDLVELISEIIWKKYYPNFDFRYERWHHNKCRYAKFNTILVSLTCHRSINDKRLFYFKCQIKDIKKALAILVLQET